jgi:hypothetical protein
MEWARCSPACLDGSGTTKARAKETDGSLNEGRHNNELQRTRRGPDGASPLNSVFDRPEMAAGRTSPAWLRALPAWLALMALAFAGAGCSQPQGGNSPPDTTPLAAPVDCGMVTVESKGAFHFQFANEWYTGRVLVAGCREDAKALQTIADGTAFEGIRELTERQPISLPACDKPETGQALVAELNGQHGAAIVKRACARVGADI